MKSKFHKLKVIHRFTLLYIWLGNVLFHHVPPKMAGGFAREVALTTLEWLYSSVLAHVYFNMGSLSAGVVALITLERFLTSVIELVYFHLSSCSA